ncbi:MAG: hypothetical protein ONB44_06105 [candidate division KSB1 bacterium]|nr:hypothetical protein [candidate division KSB1 bacterium]MDZ7301695.1 hypothetical protein [candidate division KSB1 bacterium]MDZ7312418.1 hypothetical protein [candidate division KSB1 bacterium]
MKHFFLILVLGFFVLPYAALATGIKEVRWDGERCNNERVIHAGTNAEAEILGDWFENTTSVSVSGSNVSATILEKFNGVQNQVRLGQFTGSVKVRFTATASAAGGDRTVTLRHGHTFGPSDTPHNVTFTFRLIARAQITSHNIPTLTGPFQTVDVTLNGSGLSNVEQVLAAVNRNRPLRDAAGQDIPGSQTVEVTASFNQQTNTNTRVVVTLTFRGATTYTQGSPPGTLIPVSGTPIDLTQATAEITLKSRKDCSGLNGFGNSGLKHSVEISAPLGINYVQDVIFDRNSRTYNIGDVVSVTIRLNRPAVGLPIMAPPNIPGGGGVQMQGENVFWTLLPSNAFEQAGPTGTPYDANIHHNTITIPSGSQTRTITFKVKSCPGGGQINTVKLVTWKPDAFIDTSPNRKEFPFTVSCQQ